ncbi:MAG: sodium:proton antiporter [Bacteroidales bacterium]|nr:sodium:proton antiporter [Bacteroidales bacterium]
MTYYIIIFLCFIILIAYSFEVTARYSKIPGVILLMILGLALRYLATHLGFVLPDLSLILPVMGTLGLILIVLEGSMDLTLNREKKSLILSSFATAIILLLVFVAIFTLLSLKLYNCSVKIAILNAIPFSVISSAVAIPSTLNLKKSDREFIIYESAFSDIIAILLFDFILFSKYSFGKGMAFFSFEVVVSLLFSIIISAGLALMLHKIRHHVKYVIILTSVILVFTFAKMIHWPSLIVVMIFGLILNNNHFFRVRQVSKRIDFFEFNKDIKSFKQITAELTFLVRSFFFLIFGFNTSFTDLIDPGNLAVSAGICSAVFLLRAGFIKFILRKPLSPLVFFAPRGLITILLFLSLPLNYKLPFMSEGLISQTIFITILVMAFGNIIMKKNRIPDQTADQQV